MTDQDINLEIRKRKFRWIDHTLQKEEDQRIAGEDQLSKRGQKLE